MPMFSLYRSPLYVLALVGALLLPYLPVYAQVVDCRVNAYTAYQYAVQHGHRFIVGQLGI